MRLFVCLGLIALLCGCAISPIETYFTPADEQLFVRGMAEINLQGEAPAAFAILRERYPESPWADRARQIDTLLENLRTQRKTIDRLTLERNAGRRESTRLQEKIDALESDREKLRQLLIDLEGRGR